MRNLCGLRIEREITMTTQRDYTPMDKPVGAFHAVVAVLCIFVASGLALMGIGTAGYLLAWLFHLSIN